MNLKETYKKQIDPIRNEVAVKSSYDVMYLD